MKKLSVLFATLMIVAISVTFCVKKAECKPTSNQNDSTAVDSTDVDSTNTAIVYNK